MKVHLARHASERFTCSDDCGQHQPTNLCRNKPCCVRGLHMRFTSRWGARVVISNMLTNFASHVGEGAAMPRATGSASRSATCPAPLSTVTRQRHSRGKCVRRGREKHLWYMYVWYCNCVPMPKSCLQLLDQLDTCRFTSNV